MTNSATTLRSARPRASMNTYTIRSPRLACVIASIAMVAVTLGVFVVAPAKLEGDSGAAAVAVSPPARTLVSERPATNAGAVPGRQANPAPRTGLRPVADRAPPVRGSRPQRASDALRVTD